MNLLDTPVVCDEPIAMWMGCHRRIEKQLKTLSKLPAHLADKGVDADASSAAQEILRYFEKSAGHHHEDEDHDLFPLLEKRIADAQEAAGFRELRARLEADHARMSACWARLRKPLQGIAEGLPKSLDAAEVEAFRAIYETHIPSDTAPFPGSPSATSRRRTWRRWAARWRRGAGSNTRPEGSGRLRLRLREQVFEKLAHGADAVAERQSPGTAEEQAVLEVALERGGELQVDAELARPRLSRLHAGRRGAGAG